MVTRSGWPVRANSLGEVPAPMGRQLAEQLAQGETIQQLVYVSADSSASRRGAWARTRGLQVRALTDQRMIIGVQAVRRDAAPWLLLPYDALVTWEIGEILLYSRLDLCAEVGGQVIRTFIEFNTVGAHLVVAALAPLERATLHLTRNGGRQRIAAGIDLPFKFANFLADALLPGEVVRDLIFQEAIVTPLFRFWRRLIAPGTVIAGTDRRLLVIREEPKLRGDRYGHMTLTLAACGSPAPAWFRSRRSRRRTGIAWRGSGPSRHFRRAAVIGEWVDRLVAAAPLLDITPNIHDVRSLLPALIEELETVVAKSHPNELRGYGAMEHSTAQILDQWCAACGAVVADLSAVLWRPRASLDRCVPKDSELL